MLIELIRNRRSCRKFLEKPVEKEKLDTLVEAALRSPSSRGFNPWQYVVVDDRELLEKLSRAKPHGSSFLKNAPLGIVVCADDTVDTWVEDCSIASTFIKLTAESLGLKSCWIQIRDRDHSESVSARDYVADQLSLAEGLNILSIIALGYPDGHREPHKTEELLYKKVHLNSHGNSYPF